MTIENDNPVDMRTNQMLMAYGEGVPVIEIAARFGLSSVAQVYKAMNNHPEEYNAAKQSLLILRIARYRRAGSLAINLQLMYLENFTEGGAKPSQETLSAEVKTIQSIGDAAERRADLNEGKPTDRTEAGILPKNLSDIFAIMMGENVDFGESGNGTGATL